MEQIFFATEETLNEHYYGVVKIFDGVETLMADQFTSIEDARERARLYNLEWNAKHADGKL